MKNKQNLFFIAVIIFIIMVCAQCQFEPLNSNYNYSINMETALISDYSDQRILIVLTESASRNFNKLWGLPAI